MIGLFLWMHLSGVYNIKIEVYKNEQMEIHLYWLSAFILIYFIIVGSYSTQSLKLNVQM